MFHGLFRGQLPMAYVARPMAMANVFFFTKGLGRDPSQARISQVRRHLWAGARQNTQTPEDYPLSQGNVVTADVLVLRRTLGMTFG